MGMLQRDKTGWRLPHRAFDKTFCVNSVECA
jgi:hypothetical protein